MAKPKNVDILTSSTNNQCSKTTIPFEEPDGMTDIDLHEIISCQSISDTKCIAKSRKYYARKLLFAIGTGFIIITCFLLTPLLLNDSITWSILPSYNPENTNFQKTSVLKDLSINTNKENMKKCDNTEQNVIFDFPSKHKIKRDLLSFSTNKLQNSIPNDLIKHLTSRYSDKSKAFEWWKLSSTTYSYDTINEISSTTDNSLNQNGLSTQLSENSHSETESVSSSLITQEINVTSYSASKENDYIPTKRSTVQNEEENTYFHQPVLVHSTPSIFDNNENNHQSSPKQPLDVNLEEYGDNEQVLTSTPVYSLESTRDVTSAFRSWENKRELGLKELNNDNLEKLENAPLTSSTTVFYETTSILANSENENQSNVTRTPNDYSEHNGNDQPVLTTPELHSTFDNWENKNGSGLKELNTDNLKKLENDILSSSTTALYEMTSILPNSKIENQSGATSTQTDNLEKDGDYERVPTSAPIYSKESTQDLPSTFDSWENTHRAGLTEPNNYNLKKLRNNIFLSSTTPFYESASILASSENENQSDATSTQTDNLEKDGDYERVPTSAPIYSKEFTQDLPSTFDSWENTHRAGLTEPNNYNLKKLRNNILLSSTTPFYESASILASSENENQSDATSTQTDNLEKDGDYERVPTSAPIYSKESTQDLPSTFDSWENTLRAGLTEPNNYNLKKLRNNILLSSTTPFYESASILASSENENQSDATSTKTDNLEKDGDYERVPTSAPIYSKESTQHLPSTFDSWENTHRAGLTEPNNYNLKKLRNNILLSSTTPFYESASILASSENENQSDARRIRDENSEEDKRASSLISAISTFHSSESKEKVNIEPQKDDNSKENKNYTLIQFSAAYSYFQEPAQQITSIMDNSESENQSSAKETEDNISEKYEDQKHMLPSTIAVSRSSENKEGLNMKRLENYNSMENESNTFATSPTTISFHEPRQQTSIIDNQRESQSSAEATRDTSSEEYGDYESKPSSTIASDISFEFDNDKNENHLSMKSYNNLEQDGDYQNTLTSTVAFNFNKQASKISSTTDHGDTDMQLDVKELNVLKDDENEAFAPLSTTASYSVEPVYEIISPFGRIDNQRESQSSAEATRDTSSEEYGDYESKPSSTIASDITFEFDSNKNKNHLTIEKYNSLEQNGDYQNRLTSTISFDFNKQTNEIAATTDHGDTDMQLNVKELNVLKDNEHETFAPLSTTASYSVEPVYEIASPFGRIESENQLAYSTKEDFQSTVTSISKSYEITSTVSSIYSSNSEIELVTKLSANGNSKQNEDYSHSSLSATGYFYNKTTESFSANAVDKENLVDSHWSKDDTSGESKGYELTSTMANFDSYKTTSQIASTAENRTEDLLGYEWHTENNLDPKHDLSTSSTNSDANYKMSTIESYDGESRLSSNITSADDANYITSKTTNSDSYKPSSAADNGQNENQIESKNDNTIQNVNYKFPPSVESIYDSFKETTKIMSNTDRNESENQESLKITHKNNLDEENYLKFAVKSTTSNSYTSINEISPEMYETVKVSSSTTEGFPRNHNRNSYENNNYGDNKSEEFEPTKVDSNFSELKSNYVDSYEQPFSINNIFNESEYKKDVYSTINKSSDSAKHGITNVTHKHESDIPTPATSEFSNKIDRYEFSTISNSLDSDEFTHNTESASYTDATISSITSDENSVAKSRRLSMSRFNRKASVLRNNPELLQKYRKNVANNSSREEKFNIITTTFPTTAAVRTSENNLADNSFPLNVRWSNQEANSFQSLKNAASVNEHLQTSQQSTVNQNFVKSLCPTFISPMGFPVLQQASAFPYLYNANQASPYANVMPFPIPRAQANSYIAQQYPYVGGNNAPSYSKAMAQQSGYLMYNVNGQNIIAPSPGGEYYVCNPLSSVLGNSNTDATSQVEIRKSVDDSNLQQQSFASENLENRTRASRNCPFEERSCEDDSKCIKIHQFCDGEVQCKDASDENFCPCKFRIGKSRQCDGYFDCPNGEDEYNCFGCEANMFSCDDWSPNDRVATCIPTEQRCDGIPQCPTEKDEHDCSILTGTLSEKQHFIVSATIGFLYRNFKGRWYPACRNPELWANEACQSAAGPSTMAPLTHLVPVDINYSGPYLSALHKKDIETVDSCEPGAAIFVECPPLVCGMRKKIRNPYRMHEVDTSAEQILSQFERTKEAPESQNITDSVLGDGRVVGGKPSQPEAWPWIVSVYRNGVFHCGGALINEQWIVTAGHCVEKYWHYYYEVQAGVLRRYSYAPMAQNRMISHVIAHQLYDRTKLKNDLALMRMSKPIMFSRYVRPICLPSEITAGKNFKWGPEPGTVCTAVGWGATVEHGSDPDHLREVEVPILKHCKHREDQEGHEICAGLMEGGKDACQGDSGGPFMCRNPNAPNQWYLAGIVSHGEGCARPNEPGVYTRVSLFLEWIFENIRAEMVPQTKPLHHCPGYICKKTNRCIANKRRCNKVVDCLLGDDEINCDKNAFNEIFKHAMRHMLLGSQQDNLDNNNNTTNLPTTNLKLPTTPPLIETNVSNTDNLENTSDVAETSTPMQKITKTISNKLLSNQSYNKNYVCKRILQTIDISKQCDRTADCEDATDEEDCTCASYLSSSHSQAICDGITDCLDMSDETNCHVCTQNEYHCRHSNICITKEKRCNNVPDCPLEEDEWDCFALTNGKTIILDDDLRPYLNDSGLVSFNHNGTWRSVCSNWTGTEATIASDTCFYLGFSDYKSFLKVPIYDHPLQIIQKSSAPVVNVSLIGNRCTALFVKCSDVIDVTHLTEHVNISKIINSMQETSWNAEVYVNGNFKCTGSILDVDWIITSTGCFEKDFKLENNYVAVLLGRSKTYFNLMGPHQQVVRIVESIQVSDSDIILLRLNNKINISRYIRPIRFSVRDYTVSERETCIALGRNLDNFTESVFLQAVTNCTFGFRCFKRTIREVCQNKHFTSWSGSIVCRSKHGWYPAAVFHESRGFCGFATTTAYTSVQYWRANILKLMRQTAIAADAPLCKGFRCSLGRCLEEHNICDGIPDCRDGGDEDPNYCSEKRKQCHTLSSCVCLKSELKCQNGKCVPKTVFCNRNNDCGDWSDEPASCSCGAYLNLTNPEKVCDGIRNCQDRTDEDPYLCNCKGYNFVCEESNHCIPQDMVCDGVSDCPNGEDETNCIALTSTSGSSTTEVQVRTAGVWYPGCFPKYLTTLQLERICENIGYTGGSAVRINPGNNWRTGWRPVTDPFMGILIHHGAKRNVIIAIRSGNKPFVSLKPDLNCNRLFLQCS